MARSIGARIAAVARKEASSPHGTACGPNKAGTSGYYTSCRGNAGQPEYWCADFVRWVWHQAGALNTDTLNAAAASFAAYGPLRRKNPRVGDAVVFNYQKSLRRADHVAVVVEVSADGTVVSIGGDEQGFGKAQAVFAGSSGVFRDGPYSSLAGTTPPTIGSPISGYVSPVEDDMPYTKKEITDLVKKGVAAELSARDTKQEILTLVKKGVAAELKNGASPSGVSAADGAKAAVSAQGELAGIQDQLSQLTAAVNKILTQLSPAPPRRASTATRAGTAPK
jgi:hypothetical protein